MTVEGVGGRSHSVDIKDEEIKKQVGIFGRLCATHEEMANYFDCTVRTIENYMQDKEGIEVSEFFRVYKTEQAKAKTSLRRMQMKKAMEGDNALLIWLGKQLLGQREKHDNINYNMTPTIIEDDIV